MSRVVLMRLVGPMQSWGVGSSHDVRDAGAFPTKSAVAGIVAAALGWGKSHDLSALAAMPMAVRADMPGRTMTDYQVRQPMSRSRDGRIVHSAPARHGEQTWRGYLADAAFAVALDAGGMADDVAQAISAPVFSPFLGRKAYRPTAPVLAGTSDAPLMEALASMPWQGRGEPPRTLAVWRDLAPGDDPALAVAMHDVPVSFDQSCRNHGTRLVIREDVPNPAYHGTDDDENGLAEADWMAEAVEAASCI